METFLTMVSRLPPPADCRRSPLESTFYLERLGIAAMHHCALLLTATAIWVPFVHADDKPEQDSQINPGLESLRWMIGDWQPTSDMKPSASGGDGWIDQGFLGLSVRSTSNGNQLRVSYTVITAALSCYADVVEIVEVCPNGDLVITSVAYENQGPLPRWSPEKIKPHPSPIDTARAEKIWRWHKVTRYKVKKADIAGWAYSSKSGAQIHRRMDPKYAPKIKDQARAEPFFIGNRLKTPTEGQ